MNSEKKIKLASKYESVLDKQYAKGVISKKKYKKEMNFIFLYKHNKNYWEI